MLGPLRVDGGINCSISLVLPQGFGFFEAKIDDVENCIVVSESSNQFICPPALSSYIRYAKVS